MGQKLLLTPVENEHNVLSRSDLELLLFVTAQHAWQPETGKIQFGGLVCFESGIATQVNYKPTDS